MGYSFVRGRTRGLPISRSSKRSINKGLLSMEPRPVIKRDSLPSTSSTVNTNMPYGQTCTMKGRRFQKGDEASIDHCQLDDDLKCPICSEIFIESTTLNCSHTYCKYCIERWRETNVDCPVCRAKIAFQVHTLALDQIIEKILKNRPPDVLNQRNMIILDRKKEVNSRRQYVQRPVQTFSCNAHMGGINIWGSILEALNDVDDGSDRQEEDLYEQCEWMAYDAGSSTDEYEEYCVYTGPGYY